MLHHVSFSVREPDRAAALVAELTCGRVVAAPSPPFPVETRFVLLGDAAGGMIELLPWGTIHSPVENGLPNDHEMRPFSASHVLVSSPHSAETLVSVAQHQQLRATLIDAGLFKFVKVWIEDSFLLELLPAETASAYSDVFSAAGWSTVDERLRQLERQLRAPT